MRIAVTGGTGTVGRAFAERAAAAGHSLVLLSRTAPDTLPANCEWQKFDLTASDFGLGDALDGAECAVHLAACVDTNPADEAAAAALWSTNVLGTGRFIEALAKAGAAHIVMASSANIYDPNVERADENTPIRPQSRTLYLSSKAAQEAYARETCRKLGIPMAILRISSVIGTGNDLASKFLDIAMSGKTIALANPEYGADMVGLDDVADGLLLAAQKRLEGDFNLSSGQRHTLEDLAVTIAKVCAAPVNINESGPHGAPDTGFPAIDCTRLSAHGYKPDALEDVLVKMRANILNGEGQA